MKVNPPTSSTAARGGTGNSDAASSAQPATASASAPFAEHQFMGKPLRLSARTQECMLEFGAASDMKSLKLPLKPPCFVIPWQEKPATRRIPGDPSDGLPVGDVGEPRAYRYPSAGNKVIIAIIGDAVPDYLLKTDEHAQRVERGYHCGGSLQGVLFDSVGNIELGKKRDAVGEKCIETGIEEKSFWLLAHD